jgi:hypothetical protein
MKFDASHWIMLGVTATAGAAIAVAQAYPEYATPAHALAALLGTIGTIVGALSPSVLTPSGAK